jgi:hypothetical protein
MVATRATVMDCTAQDISIEQNQEAAQGNMMESRS